MTKHLKIATSRVFRAGNSQAVRIPKAFELPEGEVRIERRPGGLFIANPHGDWVSFFAETGVRYPLQAKALRDGRTARPVEVAWVQDLSEDASAAKIPQKRPRPGRNRGG